MSSLPSQAPALSDVRRDCGSRSRKVCSACVVTITRLPHLRASSRPALISFWMVLRLRPVKAAASARDRPAVEIVFAFIVVGFLVSRSVRGGGIGLVPVHAF